MNKKMKLVLDIMQLGVEISKNTKTDVFVKYAGHVDSLDIIVFYSGWSEGRNADYKKGTYLNTNDYRTKEIIIAILNEMYVKLMDIYKEEENNEVN